MQPPTATPLPPTSSGFRCAYVWGSNGAPTYAVPYRAALEAAGFHNYTLSMVAQGENIVGEGCDGFSSSGTYLIHLTVTDPTATTRDELGNIAIKVLRIPYTASGRIDLVIQGKDISVWEGFTFSEGRKLAKQEINGTTFLDELAKLR